MYSTKCTVLLNELCHPSLLIMLAGVYGNQTITHRKQIQLLSFEKHDPMFFFMANKYSNISKVWQKPCALQRLLCCNCHISSLSMLHRTNVKSKTSRRHQLDSTYYTSPSQFLCLGCIILRKWFWEILGPRISIKCSNTGWVCVLAISVWNLGSCCPNISEDITCWQKSVDACMKLRHRMLQQQNWQSHF